MGNAVSDPFVIEITGYVEFPKPYRLDSQGRQLVARFHATIKGIDIFGIFLTRKTNGNREFEISLAGFSRSSRVAFPRPLMKLITKEALSHRRDITCNDGRSALLPKSQNPAGRGASSNAGEPARGNNESS